MMERMLVWMCGRLILYWLFARNKNSYLSIYLFDSLWQGRRAREGKSCYAAKEKLQKFSHLTGKWCAFSCKPLHFEQYLEPSNRQEQQLGRITKILENWSKYFLIPFPFPSPFSHSMHFIFYERIHLFFANIYASCTVKSQDRQKVEL